MVDIVIGVAVADASGDPSESTSWRGEVTMEGGYFSRFPAQESARNRISSNCNNLSAGDSCSISVPHWKGLLSKTNG
jgi:hypothetical protein